MSDDIVPILRTIKGRYVANSEVCQDAADEIISLRRWKVEAADVISNWEQVWQKAGEPGELGDFRWDALWAEIERLRAAQAPQAGVMHEVDRAFYDVAILQRNAAWRESERLRRELDALRSARSAAGEEIL